MLLCIAPKFPTSGKGLSPAFPAPKVTRARASGCLCSGALRATTHPLCPSDAVFWLTSFQPGFDRRAKTGPFHCALFPVGASSFLQAVPNWTNLLIPYSPYEHIIPKHKSFLSQLPLAFLFRSHPELLGNQSIQPVLSTRLGGARLFILFLWKIPSESSDPCSYRTMNYEKCKTDHWELPLFLQF